MLIQKQAKVRVLGAAMIFALMFVCSIAAFAAVTASSTSIQFPSTAVGAKSAAMSVTITNNATSSVVIQSATVSSAQFSFSGPAFPVTLAAGQGFTGSVTFSPAAAQAYSGTVKFKARGGSILLTVNLSGTGTAVAQTSPYVLVPTPGSLAFSGAVGSSPACQNVDTLDTTPAGPLPVAMSTDVAWLTVTPTVGQTELTLIACVKTAGLAAGTFTGHVIVTMTGPNNGGQTVNNSPMSIPVTLVLTGAQTHALTAAPSALSFSAQVGVAAPATQSLTIGENPAGAVAFTASADQAWITLSAASGTTSSAIQVGANITGLAAGSYSGHVNVTAAGLTNSPMSIPVTMVVAAAVQTHALTASASVFTFSAQAGAAAPATQSLTIGENPAGAVAFAVSADQTWVTLSAASGTTSGTIQVGAKVTGLAAGTYSAHVNVTAAGVTNSPMSIPVTMVVTAAQTFALTSAPSAISFSATAGGTAPAAQSLTIGDSPASVLPYTVSADQAWISLSATSGTTSGAVQVSANITGLAAGSYSGHVIVSAAGVTNSPMSIPVTMVVAAAQGSSLVSMSPAPSFSAQAGGVTPAAQTLIIVASPAAPLPVTTTVDQPWIVVTGGTGTTKATMQIAVNMTGMAAGTYSGHVMVSSPGVPNSPMSIPVSFLVTGTQTSTLTAAPSSMAFTSVAGGTAPATQSLTIGETPAGAVAFTVTADQAWMTLSAASGTTSSAIQVGANISGLAAGNYTGHVITTAGGVTNSPMSVTVTLAVTAAQTNLLSVSPTSEAFGSINVGNNNTKSVTITNSGTASVTISSVTVTGAGMSANGIATPMTLTAGQATVLSVVFAPTAVGAVTGTVSVASNATNTPGVITVTGTGVQPQMTASPSTLNFGSVGVGSSGLQTITLSNTGGAAATISQAVISGTGYTMSGLTIPTTVAAGASVSFSVKFAPAATGSVSGSVTVTSNTPNSPTMIALNGTGTAAVVHSVSLAWVASTSSVVGYNVYRGSVSGGPYTMLNSTPDAVLSYTDMAVTAGQTYFYVVTAVDASGNESIVSNQVSVLIATP